MMQRKFKCVVAHAICKCIIQRWLLNLYAQNGKRRFIKERRTESDIRFARVSCITGTQLHIRLK